MPPKKNEPNKKNEQQKKEKIIEDKTFGLKNKKGAKQQKFITMVTQQVKTQGTNQRKAERMQQEAKAQDPKMKREEKLRQLQELNSLFKPVVDQKVEAGVDPKSVLCVFYKQGLCSKGNKCKFSHDLAQERKAEKRDIYRDSREEADNMDNWDEQRLQEVVDTKHGEIERTKPKTEIICMHFLEAVENGKYGWFWECPNGNTKCHYRHALPAGFVLKKDKKRLEAAKGDELTLEELIETERKEKCEARVAEQERKQADYRAGRLLGISGREMFQFDPTLVGEEEDDEEGCVVTYEPDPDDPVDDQPAKELDLEQLVAQATEVDLSSLLETRRVYNASEMPAEQLNDDAAEPNDMIATTSALTNNADDENVQIDEDLFGGEDLDFVNENLDEQQSDSGDECADEDDPEQRVIPSGSSDVHAAEQRLDNLRLSPSN